jgi:Antibiotic biosynthesis monooxygenase
MSVVVVVTAFPVPEHRAEVIAAFEEAITRVHDEPGVELYALHEGPDRLVRSAGRFCWSVIPTAVRSSPRPAQLTTSPASSTSPVSLRTRVRT